MIRRHLRTCVAVGCLWLSAVAAAEATLSAGLRIGTAAPELVIDSYAPGRDAPLAGLADLRGQVVMLEFWTTWCVGCVAAMPHMNELVSDLKDEAFRLITVSNEDPDYVMEFLKTRELTSLLAFDQHNRTTESYGVGCYPLAVLLDKEGTVRAITSPDNITSDHIRKILAGDPIQLPLVDPATGEPARVVSKQKAEDPEQEPAFGIQIEPNPERDRAMMLPPDHGILSADAYSLRLLIATAYGVSQWFETDYRLPESDVVYRVEVRGAHGEAGREILRAAIHAMFDLKTRWEKRGMDVFVLRSLSRDPAPNRSPSDADQSTGMATPVSFDLEGASIRKLARLLSNMVLDTLVIDESGLDGKYDLSANWTRGDVDSLKEALGLCGLSLTQEQREVRILIVEPAN